MCARSSKPEISRQDAKDAKKTKMKTEPRRTQRTQRTLRKNKTRISRRWTPIHADKNNTKLKRQGAKRTKTIEPQMNADKRRSDQDKTRFKIHESRSTGLGNRRDAERDKGEN